VKVVDFTEVKTTVILPKEWVDRAHQYESTIKFLDNKRSQELGSWQPESHPSYGCISLFKTSGTTRLFGSGFNHQHFMSLRISRAERSRSHGNDHHFERDRLIEIHMSEVQWASLVSSVGLGSGVPCTINTVYGDPMPEPPAQLQIERYHEDIEKAGDQAAKFLDEALAELTALSEEKSPSKTRRAEVLEKVRRARAKLDDSAPFYVKQLHEHMEKVVSDGKAEIEAYARSVIIDSGIKQLAESIGHETARPFKIESGEE